MAPLVLGVMAVAHHQARLQSLNVLKASAGECLAVAVALLIATVAGSYLGVAASALARSRGQLLALVLPGLLLTGVGVTLSSELLVSVVGQAVWLWPLAP